MDVFRAYFTDEEEKDEWDPANLTSIQNASLIDEALDEELEEEQDKNIKIAIQ